MTFIRSLWSHPTKEAKHKIHLANLAKHIYQILDELTLNLLYIILPEVLQGTKVFEIHQAAAPLGC